MINLISRNHALNNGVENLFMTYYETKIITDVGRLTVKLSSLFGLFSEAHIARNQMLCDFRKCHKLQSS